MDYPPNVYMSPRNVIARFNAMIKRCGAECIETPGNFKDEKELLTVAKFYLGVYLWTGYDYYLRPWEDVSPDVDVRAINWGDPEEETFQVEDIQVTEYEGHNSEITDVIASKIKAQSPHGQENRHLLVVVREHAGEKIYHVKAAKAVEAMKPSFQSIWLLIQTHEDSSVYRVIRIWPTPEIVDIKFRIKDVVQRQKPPDFVNIKRGAKNANLSGLYHYELPLPECPNHPA